MWKLGGVKHSSVTALSLHFVPIQCVKVKSVNRATVINCNRELAADIRDVTFMQEILLLFSLLSDVTWTQTERTVSLLQQLLLTLIKEAKWAAKCLSSCFL